MRFKEHFKNLPKKTCIKNNYVYNKYILKHNYFFMYEKVYLAVLHKLGFNHKDFYEIFKEENNFKEFYESLSYYSLKKYNFLDKKIEKILDLKEKTSLKKVEKILKDLDIKIILHSENDYPENLKHIFNPPFLFYLRGKLVSKSISFIGARNITSYGKKAIEHILPKVWKYFSIVSGWAAWCDSYSHKIALKNSIKTLSVFWTGIDIFYPKSSEKVFFDILKNDWWLISIFPLWEIWFPHNFPIRNEIVAGLSEWVVVIEAKEKSGSLITAKLALDLGKDLFAVPWEIFKPYSFGCNSLIWKWEAKLVLEPWNILSEYNISNKKEKKKSPKFSSELEKIVFETLLLESLWVDELAKKLDYSFDEILLQLTMMELSCLIKKWDLWKYEIF